MADHLLTDALQAAVPIEILHMRDWTPRDRTAYVDHLRVRGLITAHGDDLMYGGRECAPTFAALTRGLAALAHQPGGVTFAGVHWCVDHAACLTAEEAAKPPVAQPDRGAPVKPATSAGSNPAGGTT